MPKAMWNGVVIAEAKTYESVEGNIYFPPSSLDRAHLEPSDKRTVCPWKGTASYFHVVVDGARLEDAAWYYPEPKQAAAQIKNHVAFWKGVQVTS